MVDRFAAAHTKKQIRLLVNGITSRKPPSTDAVDIYSELYTETMVRINRQSSEDRELARKTLLWITTATRLLTTAELQCALSIGPGDTEYDDENICSVELLIVVCAGLVVVDPQTQIIRLVHYTAQEFFERTTLDTINQKHYEITQTCLIYLCFEQFRRPTNVAEPDSLGVGFLPDRGWVEFDADSSGYHERDQSHAPSSYESGTFGLSTFPESAEAGGPLALLSYAANSWAAHAYHCQDKIYRLSLRLLDNQKLSSHAFYAATTLHQPWYFLRMEPSRQIQSTGLHLISAFGLDRICQNLLERRLHPNVEDGAGRTPLMLAAHHGHCEVVALLLEQERVKLSSQCKRGDSVLHYAARQGHVTVVEMILKKTQLENEPANTHTANHALWTANFFQETALTQAALGGHENVVEYLCASHAPEWFRQSVHQEIIFGIWPVHKAAQRLPVETLKVLVDVCKVSIDQQDPKGYSPFAVAVDWGNEQVVRYFFAHQKTWLAANSDQVILAAHLAAANSRRLSVLEIIVESADYVLTTPNAMMNDVSLLSAAVDAGNMRAAMYIAEQLEI